MTSQSNRPLHSEESAGAIVFHQAANGAIEYLLLRSSFWGFPKGLIEAGEDDRVAARREIKEETGLDVMLVDDFCEVDHYTYESKQRGLIQKQVTYFLAQAQSRDAALSSEHSDIVWLAFDEALARLEIDQLRALLKRAKEFIEAQNVKHEALQP